VLRYRLRAKPGDRPSSLAHTGEPLLEPDSHDDACLQDQPFHCLDAISLSNDGSYCVDTGKAALQRMATAAALAADSHRFWMGDQTKMLPTPLQMLPRAAVAGLLNWSSPEAQFHHALALSPPCVPVMQEVPVPSPAFTGAAWDGFAVSSDLKWSSSSSCKKLPSMEVRGRA
jgi:hypothetical protein